jgi:hypothetical protein
MINMEITKIALLIGILLLIGCIQTRNEVKINDFSYTVPSGFERADPNLLNDEYKVFNEDGQQFWVRENDNYLEDMILIGSGLATPNLIFKQEMEIIDQKRMRLYDTFTKDLITINGLEAEDSIFTGSNNTRKFRQVTLKKGKFIYIIIYGGKIENYDKYKDVFENSLQTIK